MSTKENIMSERYRNDLYYIERMSGDTAIYPDGTVGEIQEKKIKSLRTVKGRRNDRTRTVEYSQTKLVQTALYDSASSYRAADQARIDAQVGRYNSNGADPSWTIEDMPDAVIAKFNKWKDSLSEPTRLEIRQAAVDAVATSRDQIENETLECKWCRGGRNDNYACRGCGYAGSFYKYPIIRLMDGERQVDKPFDVARFVFFNTDALSYEVRTMFNHEGKMAAEQVAVLRVTDVIDPFLGHSNVTQVDPADQLHGEITIPIARWKEDKRWPYSDMPLSKGGSDPASVITALQEKCALELARERSDNAEYQGYYEQFASKLRALGKGAMTAVVRTRYEGQGEVGYEMQFGNLPFEPGYESTVVYSFEMRELFKKVVPLIDTEKGVINLRWEGGF
jgi:hypothetical protein